MNRLAPVRYRMIKVQLPRGFRWFPGNFLRQAEALLQRGLSAGDCPIFPGWLQRALVVTNVICNMTR